MPIRPIFVLGMPRSGTTLTGGLLAQHPLIAGVSEERYGGLKESDIFGQIEEYFGNLADPIDFVRFLETFAASDYFRGTGLDKELFYRARPTDFTSFFNLLMNTFAENRECTHWVEKSPAHLLCFERILERFPKAFIVIIQRNQVDCVRSHIALRSYTSRRAYRKAILKAAVTYAIYRSRLDDLVKSVKPDQSIIVGYDDLKTDIPRASLAMCDGLGLQYADAMHQAPYSANSSFHGSNHKKRASQPMPKGDRLLIVFAQFAVRLLPKCVRKYASRRLLLWAKRPMAHHWGLLLEEHGFDERTTASGGWGGIPKNRPEWKGPA